MVRLKVPMTASRMFSMIFQFQYGAIKSRKMDGCTWYFDYFNSNMVRLKEVLAEKVKVEVEKFQFQYGAIKRALTLKQKLLTRHFNSNMVRLKE